MRAGMTAFVICVIAIILTAIWPLLAAILSGTVFSALLVWHLRVFSFAHRQIFRREHPDHNQGRNIDG
jgi:membrane protein CcdC involved in cytochrome C biogenesis